MDGEAILDCPNSGHSPRCMSDVISTASILPEMGTNKRSRLNTVEEPDQSEESESQ